ncbi:dihydroneopterin aldolase [Pacificispira sp.]|uniref:dihydroneopterin aldolase n=1 Tax=Pacificispira sp. TaxID=2888761 RepID=UPI003BAB85C8
MTDQWQIRLEDFEAIVRIGVHDFERTGPQRLIFTVRLDLDYAFAGDSDDLASVVDYDFVRAEILNRVSGGHIETQEKLISDLADAYLRHARVSRVEIFSRKPDVYPEPGAIGVSLVRCRSGDSR